jgi:tetratricopeptide (TPR) repeat protein
MHREEAVIATFEKRTGGRIASSTQTFRQLGRGDRSEKGAARLEQGDSMGYHRLVVVKIKDEQIAAIFDRAMSRYVTGDLLGAIGELEGVCQIAQSRSARDQFASVLALIQKAGWLREVGRIKEGLDCLRQAELCLPTPPDDMQPELRIGLSLEQAIVTKRRGDLAAAEELLLKAKDLATQHRSETMSDVLANLAMVYLSEGKIEQARQTLKDAIALDRQAEDPRRLSRDLNMLALTYMGASDADTAAPYLREAFSVAFTARLKKEMAHAAANLAALWEEAGKVDLARETFEATLRLYEQMGDEASIASTLSSLAILAQREQGYDKAFELHSQALRVHEKLDALHAVYDLINLSALELSRHRPDCARDYGSRALALAEQQGQLEVMWETHHLLALAWTGCATEADADAAPQLLQNALESHLKAADAIDLLRSGIGRPEERQPLLRRKEAVYEDGLLLAASLGVNG